MNQLLINKYKPKILTDFNFPKNIENLINTIINTEQYNILITGNHSAGKTSLIKLLVSKYYDIPIKDDNNKIDTLNNNILYVTPLKDVGIHNFRSEIKIFCQSYCTINKKKKFVIIDDIDLMKEQIQQVMRNIIDVYKNVYFICSCTNSSKVIDNLQSRLFILKLPNTNNERLKMIYDRINKTEKFNVENNEVIDVLIKLSNNSPAVLINYLDVFILLDSQITKQIMLELCTTINFSLYDNFFDLLEQHNINESIRCLMGFTDQGYSVMDVYDSMFNYIKYSTKINEETKYIIIPIICKYITIFHELHEDEIELAFFTNTIYKKIVKKI